ncbi:hypothetical protein NEIRO03_2658 [Nematocida sp. AWRm78]|nr:hypothetical protein NEIRO02_2668 [Nematocida sp. AWRm79]KAI5188000.1 hypothetical protein NEIRO03_2658 [Nematocida sp. AWRm78]
MVVGFYRMRGTMSNVEVSRPRPRSLIELYNWKLKLYKTRIIKNFNGFTYCTRELTIIIIIILMYYVFDLFYINYFFTFYFLWQLYIL